MRGRLLLAGVAASLGLAFVPGLTSAAGAASCGYPAFSCSKPLMSNNPGSSAAPTTKDGSVPFSGVDVAELSAIGVAALGAGMLLRRGRHSQT